MVRRYAALKDHYDVIKTIGTGGFAKVKLATHILTGEKVAIKIMEKELLGEDLPRVKMELEALKNLTHEHICRLYQVIETDTHYFLVMEYCAGGELFDHIVQCNRLSELESRSFFRQILAAVAYLHSKGYVHRDLKPENVLLDKDQNVKLIDFGLCAKPVPAINCHLNTACGSPTYAAPELIKGEKYLGSAVDVWSMGVMLYALLCGSLPFDSDKIDVLYRQILTGTYVTPPYLSKGSCKILRDMLETDPTKRVTIEQLLCHPWVTLVFGTPVSYNEHYKDMKKDNNCVNTVALHYGLSGEEVWRRLTEEHYDELAATYQLLLLRKRQGLPLRLNTAPRSTPQAGRRLELRAEARRPLRRDAKGTFAVLPSSQATPGEDEKENNKEDGKMQPPDSTPARMLRKRPRSATRESSASPVPKRAAKPKGSSSKPEDSVTAHLSVPSTPTSSTSSPSSRFLNSIERKIQRVRNVLTPKRRYSEETPLPILLTAKNMSNISTTSSSSPDYVKEELVKALNSRGIECKCKGYLIKGKQQTAKGKVCKLSFELEVCLIPTTTSTNGSVVGIRRKRLKGDAWNYKRVCEEVLKMADL